MKIKVPIRPAKPAVMVLEDPDAPRKSPVAVGRIRMKHTVPDVVPPTAAFPTMLAAMKAAAKEKLPVMEVTFRKPFQHPKKKRKVVTEKIKGKLMQWGGIVLVCHRSPYHQHEWLVSEFTTGLNVCSKEKYTRKYDALHAGSRPTEAEAREEAVLFLMRYGVRRVRRQIARRPARNEITPEIARHIEEILYA